MAKWIGLPACGVGLLAAGTWAQEDAAAAVGYAMTPERLAASAAALLALAGVVIGGWALVRARRAGGGLNGGIAALVAGLIGMLLGGFVVATADGGLGTGNGLGGGVVAVVLGVIGVLLGGLARLRARRAG